MTKQEALILAATIMRESNGTSHDGKADYLFKLAEAILRRDAKDNNKESSAH